MLKPTLCTPSSRPHTRHDRGCDSAVLVPAVRGKKLTAAFDGGRLSSDGGVMLLAEAARRMGIAEKRAAVKQSRIK